MGDTHTLDPLNDRGGAIVLEADGAADTNLRSVHIAIAVGYGDHGADLAGQAHGIVSTAGVWMVERDVLGDADTAVLANGDGEGRRARTGFTTFHTANDQAVLQIQADGLPIGGGEPGIAAVTTDDGQAEHGSGPFVVLTGAAAGDVHHRAFAGRIARAGKVGTGIAHAREKAHHRPSVGVVVVGIAARGWCGNAILRAGTLVVGNAHALDSLDGCGRSVVDEADQLANIGAGNGLIAVAVGNGQYGADQAAEVDTVIGVARIGVMQGLVLNNTDNAGVRVDGNGERSVTTCIATNHQAVFHTQGDGATAGSSETNRLHLRALFAFAASDQRQGIDGGSTTFIGTEVIVGHDRRSSTLRVGAHVGRRIGYAIEHR